MAVIKGKPVSLTQVTEAAYNDTHPHLRPQKLVIVGDMPVPAAEVVALTAVPASFADLAAARTYLNTLVTELKSSDYFS